MGILIGRSRRGLERFLDSLVLDRISSGYHEQVFEYVLSMSCSTSNFQMII